MRPHPLFQNHRGFSSFFRRIDVHELYITLGSGLKGDRFSPAFYSEMGRHDHGYQDASGFVPEVKVSTQPVFHLNMGYADLTPGNANRGNVRVIVSFDRKADDDGNFRAVVGDSFLGSQTITRSQDVGLSVSGIKGFKPVGADGSSVREGPKYEWARDLQIIVGKGDKRKNITSEFLKRIANKNWAVLGEGKQGGFNGENTGLVDVTNLFLAAEDSSEDLVSVEFSLADSGGKIVYDIFCD